jgi:hypothetical protein
MLAIYPRLNPCERLFRQWLRCVDDPERSFVNFSVHCSHVLLDFVDDIFYRVEAFVDLLKPFVDLLKPFVDLLKPFVNLIESFLNIISKTIYGYINALDFVVNVHFTVCNSGIHRIKSILDSNKEAYDIKEHHRDSDQPARSDDKMPIHDLPLEQNVGSFFFFFAHKRLKFGILSFQAAMEAFHFRLNSVDLGIQMVVIASSHPEKRSNRQNNDQKLYPFSHKFLPIATKILAYQINELQEAA